jgi:hypothetical protein
LVLQKGNFTRIFLIEQNCIKNNFYVEINKNIPLEIFSKLSSGYFVFT